MMSTKKRDTCLSTAASSNNPSPTSTVSVGPIRILAGTVSSYHPGIHAFLYVPTYRWLVPNNAAYMSYRTSSRPYYKGFAERFNFTTNDGSMWTWRRIVFTSKDNVLVPLLVQAQLGAQATAAASTNRPFRDLSGEGSGNYQTTLTAIYGGVFEGIDSTDWTNPMIAKVDRTRITPIMDRKYTFRSGNAAGVDRLVKTYCPINKTLVYDDEENGVSVTPSPHSVTTKGGMGDLYVLDFFHCAAPLDSVGSVLVFDSSSTLYWHEK